MLQQKKLSLVTLVLLASLFVASVFQNCAKVNYQALPNAKVAGVNVVTKQVSINPAFNPQNADMKVLIVVDDSYTMSQSQSRLSSAMDSLLNPLEGRNVDFKIVSTSGIPDNQIDYDIQTTNISASTVQNTFSNSIGNRHGTLRSLQGYNATQFATLKNQIKSAILAVGTNGSDTEEGFCAAARQLFDTSSNRFFNLGDKTAIIFLTDEDDASTYSKCLSAYQENTSASQVVIYNYTQKRAKLTLEYQVNRDGLVSWYPVTWGISLPSPNNYVLDGNCSVSDLAAVQDKITQMGYTIRNVGTCTYEAVQANYYGADLGDNGSVPSKNLCSGTVTYQGQSYSNLYTFVAAGGHSAISGSCTKQTVSTNSVTASSNIVSVIKSDAVASDAQDLRSALVNKSHELFGTGFIFASIIRRNGETCSLQTGQSYGAKYEQLTTNLNSNAVIETMCATNFSTVLANVSTFIQNTANRSYVIPDMATDESVFSVGIRRNNNLIALSSTQFEAVGSTITLTNYSLFQGDIIEVTYGK
jgi:hypothetical protein